MVRYSKLKWFLDTTISLFVVDSIQSLTIACGQCSRPMRSLLLCTRLHTHTIQALHILLLHRLYQHRTLHHHHRILLNHFNNSNLSNNNHSSRFSNNLIYRIRIPTSCRQACRATMKIMRGVVIQLKGRLRNRIVKGVWTRVGPARRKGLV